jgi:hypothetical protein
MDLISSYNLLDTLMTYVKDEDGNFSTLTQAFNSMVTCIPLRFITPSQVSYFGHAFSKGCQYVCNDVNVYVKASKRLV